MMENGSLISTFLPQIMKNWDQKSQILPNFRKEGVYFFFFFFFFFGGGGVVVRRVGVWGGVGVVGWGLYRGASLLTSHMQCPHPHPRMCLRCISCLEYLLAIYGITYVQPTNSISMVEKTSLYFKLELVSFCICHILPCLCLCWL